MTGQIFFNALRVGMRMLFNGINIAETPSKDIFD